MNICFTGDSIMLTPPSSNYWANNELLDVVNNCDIRCSNLEMVLSADHSFASTFCGGQWLTTDSNILDYLQRFGFDYYNTANNHTMDFSYAGMRITNQLLDNKGILHSGSGDSLEEASSAVYKTIKELKIAFISCTASCDDAARAGDPTDLLPARPGVNMLRHSEVLYVTQEQLDIIDEIAELTCVNARLLKAVRMGIHSLPDDIHRLGRLQFKVGDSTHKTTECNRRDLKRILNSIDSAKKNGADLVFVNIHSHDIKGKTDDTPDYYMEEFAHVCIDRGATAVIGTGTHQLKGIELYKGKPIFYSLGNYIFSNEIIKYSPADYFERYGVDTPITPEDFYMLRSKNKTVGLDFDPYNYRSIIPIISFDSNLDIEDICLVPIELGFAGGEREKGYPYLATLDEGSEIYSRLQKLSSVYNTRMDMEDKNIRINLK